MNVDKVNLSFGARISVEKLQRYNFVVNELQRTAPFPSQVSTGSGYLSSSVSTTSAVSAIKTTAAGSSAVGTAFSADASGVNMSGIVPSVIAKIAPSAAPETVWASAQHPEAVGGLLSTFATWLNRFAHITDNRTVRNFPS